MPRRPPPSDLPPELAALIAGATPDELRELTGRVLDLGAARAGRLAVPERVSRRHPRSRSPFSTTVRVDLQGAEPPIWRRVELPSTLHLDALHELLQMLFGWDDGHLHRFTQGATVWDRDAEIFLCPQDVAEGDDEGVPTAEVRLDEVLAEPGDRLVYVYDYGDEWTLVLAVESTGPPVARPRCVGGRGTVPPEDYGGIEAWNDMPDDDAGSPFDAVDLDEDLADWAAALTLPPALRALQRQVVGTAAGAVLQRLLDDAALLDGPNTVDEGEAAEMVRPYSWLLERVGDGLRLTAAGWLPPAVVLAAVADLGLADGWIGKGNREDLTQPVRVLRSSAQRLGLLRVSKGRLLRTKVGVAMGDDPYALWRHVAQRAGGGARDPFAQVATALVLLAVAAGRPRDADLSGVLAAAGWRTARGSGPDRWTVQRAAEQAVDVLDAVGAYGERTGRREWTRPPTAGARALARVALRAGGH